MSQKEFQEAFRRFAMFPQTKLKYNTFRKLRALKTQQVGFKSWETWFEYITRNINLEPTLHERVAFGTQQALLSPWMENFADNMPNIRFGDAAYTVYPKDYKQKNLLDLVEFDPVLEHEADFARMTGPIIEVDGVKIRNPPKSSAVVIGRGPSIFSRGHLQLLATAQQRGEYKGLVVASDGGFVPALEAGVKVDIVVTVDGASVIKKWFDNQTVMDNGKGIKLILTVTAHHSVYEAAKKAGMDIYWFNPWFDDDRQNESFTKIQRLLTVTPQYRHGIIPMNSGGNCITGDSLLMAPDGCLFSIKDALVGQTVCSFNGKIIESAQITDVIPQGEVEVFELRTNTRSIRATVNHKFLVLSADKENEAKFIYTLVWKPLKELKTGDYVIIQTENIFERTVASAGITEDFMQFLGAFIGDGYIRKRKHSSSVHLCIPKDDKSREKYVNLIIALGFKPKLEINAINIYNTALSRQIDELGFNKKAKEKTIPDWVFKLPKKYQFAFVNGILDTDGCIAENGSWSFELSSKNLVEKLRMLLITIGYRVDNIYSRQRNITIVNKQGRIYRYHNQLSYRVRVTTQNGGKQRYYNQQSIKGPKGTWITRHSFPLPEGLALDYVTEITPKGKEQVYDITVNKNSCFSANGIIVHNSGACAWITAMEVFKRAPIALIGLDLGYPGDTPLEKTQYFNSIYREAKGNVNLIKLAYPRYHHPVFGTEAYADFIFNHYRLAMIELQQDTQMWYRIFGGTHNCTEQGTLWGPGITCEPFSKFLEENKV